MSSCVAMDHPALCCSGTFNAAPADCSNTAVAAASSRPSPLTPSSQLLPSPSPSQILPSPSRPSPSSQNLLAPFPPSPLSLSLPPPYPLHLPPQVYLDLDWTLLEMNPFTLDPSGKPFPLDMRGELDDTAAFRSAKKWGDVEFPLPFGRTLTPQVGGWVGGGGRRVIWGQLGGCMHRLAGGWLGGWMRGCLVQGWGAYKGAEVEGADAYLQDAGWQVWRGAVDGVAG